MARKPVDIIYFFGQSLRDARLAANLTQAALSHSARFSQTKLSAVESGKVEGLRLVSAEKLARATGNPLCRLLPPK